MNRSAARIIMDVKLLHENEDGSACYSFDLTEEERNQLLSFGIIEALKAGLREGEKLTCRGEEIEG
jgi:hypothetical protein